MNFEEFAIFQGRLLEEVIRIGETKGKEYAGTETNRFANFDRLASQLKTTNIQVGFIYLAKHMDSIASYCANNRTFSNESIRGRFVDAICYLTLLAGMVEEQNKSKEQKTLEVANNVFGIRCIRCGYIFEPYSKVMQVDGKYIHEVCPKNKMASYQQQKEVKDVEEPF